MVIFVWHCIVIFVWGKHSFHFVCDFLRVIHSNFCMENIVKMYGNFCVCTICKFCMGKMYGNFFVWQFLYGNFCMAIFVWYFCMVFLYGKTLTFLCGNFCMVFFLVFDPSFSLFIHPLVLPFC